MAQSPKYKLYLKFNNERYNPDGHEVIKKLRVLPLLPEEKSKEGLEVNRELIKQKFDDPDCKTKQKLFKKWAMFLDDYMTKEWIIKITHVVLSLYNERDRTNNHLESYHRTLNQKLRAKPSCIDFVGKELIIAKYPKGYVHTKES